MDYTKVIMLSIASLLMLPLAAKTMVSSDSDLQEKLMSADRGTPEYLNALAGECVFGQPPFIVIMMKNNPEIIIEFTEVAANNIEKMDVAALGYIMDCNPHAARLFAEMAAEKIEKMDKAVLNSIIKRYLLALKLFKEAREKATIASKTT